MIVSREPQSEDEQEFVENIFDCLCSCLMLPENKTLFVKAEGVLGPATCYF